MEMEWHEKHFEKDVNNDLGYVECHTQVCVNIECPRWLDWWWGGLQFHNEHHAFPRMGREFLREASKETREWLNRNGVVYHKKGFFESLKGVSAKLKDVRRFADLLD